jgi:hypothetical protein
MIVSVFETPNPWRELKGGFAPPTQVRRILAVAAVGLGLGYFAAIWGKNSELGALIAVPLATLLGVVGAFGCYRRNRQRARQKQ